MLSRTQLANTTLAVALAVTSRPLLAQKQDVGQVDAVLDRLERRLLDQESSGLTYGERESATKGPELDAGKPKGASYHFEKASILGSTPESDQLKEIGRLVNDLENQVDTLAANVQKTKQGILDEAAIDNFVSLEATLQDTDVAGLKSLIVKLDGFRLYEIHDSTGLWLPAKAIPLYAGPLQPGTHRLDIEARLIMRHAKALPMTADVYRFVNKSFQWIIPGNVASNSRYILTLTPPQKLDGVADASFKEAL